MRNVSAEPVLRWVNACRKDQGLPPLEDLRPGTRMGGFSCPVARSLSDDGPRFLVDRLMAKGPGYVFPLPYPVRMWIRHFDRGLYREYIA